MRPTPFPISDALGGGHRDTLGPKELYLARNSYLRPESDAVRKIWGRTLFGSLGARLMGLEWVSFRTGGQFLIGAAGSNYYSAAVGATGSFASIAALANPVGNMECAYYDGTDRAYIVDGLNAGQAWSGSGLTRAIGLLSPTTALTVAVLSNAATTYPAGSIFSYAYAWYDSVNGLESGPSPVSQNAIVAAGDTMKLTIPARPSSQVDKVRIYRTQVGGSVYFRLAQIASQSVTSFYYDGTNTDAGAPASDNTTVWGFATFDDIFLSAQPTLPMVGTPLTGNYMTVNAQPPIGNILGFYQNSMLISGVPGFPQDIYYSSPDNPEQFSPAYFLREENDRGDPVTAVGIANSRLIAFTLNSVFRHDNLPLVTDPGYGLGVSTRQEVTKDHGCIGKRALANFGSGAFNNRLLYLSEHGPWMTDGYFTVPLGQDLDWTPSVINTGALSGAVVKNFPKYYTILVAVPSSGSTVNDIAFLYHYHRTHLKQGTGIGKWTGPVDLRCAAAAIAYSRTSETQLFTGDTDTSGNVYLEDQGSTDASHYIDSAGSIDWEVITGDRRVGAESENKFFGRAFVSLEGTSRTPPCMEYAVSKRDALNPVTLSDITVNAPTPERIGATTGTTRTTATMRGGIWQTGSHLRLRLHERVAGVDRAITSIEVESEPSGPQL